MRNISLLLLTTLFIVLTGCQGEAQEKKIGVIVPLENKSLTEIVEGFSETLRATSPYPIKIKVANAQGDLNIQRAIIQQLKNEHYDVLVPIGTTATQMTVAMVHTQPIVSLAANFSEEERKQCQSCQIAVVHDEISPKQLITFIHQADPAISHLTLIHSASDKIFPDVQAAVAAGKSLGIEIKPLMVPTLNELYSISHAMPQQTQAILILKDILIASGISTLKMVTDKQHLPLITADQGTVQEGATFALGVRERDIGVEGAKLAAAVLTGKSARSLPIVEMTRLTVFINPAAITQANPLYSTLTEAANHFHYAIEPVPVGKK